MVSATQTKNGICAGTISFVLRIDFSKIYVLLVGPFYANSRPRVIYCASLLGPPQVLYIYSYIIIIKLDFNVLQPTVVLNI